MARIVTKPDGAVRRMYLTEGTKEWFEQSQGSLSRACAEDTGDESREWRTQCREREAAQACGSQTLGACMPVGDSKNFILHAIMSH